MLKLVSLRMGFALPTWVAQLPTAAESPGASRRASARSGRRARQLLVRVMWRFSLHNAKLGEGL